MNRRLGVAVQALVFAAGAEACIDVQGGALEGGWVINAAANGLRINCACAQLKWVRFALQPSGGGDDPCAENDRCRFSCSTQTGTTQFVIPEGSYAISVIPLDADGAPVGPAEGVVAPAPISRGVRAGELTSLGVSLLTAAHDRLAGPSACDAEWLREPL